MKPSQFLRILKQKKLLLPPLSGYTDYPFRVILAQFHPPFITTEMANARAIVQHNPRTMKILRIADGKHYNGVQLIGGIPEYMKKAAVIVQDLGFDYIDINMGCTARKVSCRGEGISLMKYEQIAGDILTAVTSAVEVPVTCKLRLGASKYSMNVVSFSQKLVEAGATALTIHARSGEKKFGMPVDFTLLTQTIETLSVPVIANGGVYTGDDAEKTLQTTGAAAVMPGRSVLGNPWIVPEIISRLSHHRYTPPTLQEKKTICLQHLHLLIDFYGPRRAILKMRSILPHYFSSCVNLKNLKLDVRHIINPQEITDLFYHIIQQENTIMYLK